uniref:Uncharacterized protein n=1 Tax=Rhipicephalus pulchellus TaxID=72859 RepID=L7LYK4_RHIPC
MSLSTLFSSSSRLTISVIVRAREVTESGPCARERAQGVISRGGRGQYAAHDAQISQWPSTLGLWRGQLGLWHHLSREEQLISS